MQYVPAFPAAIDPIASALLEFLCGASSSRDAGFVVVVAGETLSAPWRLRTDPAALRATLAASTHDARLLALCLGTRDYDGFVREDCLRALVGADCPWVVPFVVALLGDYVDAIAQCAAAALDVCDPGLLDALARDNPAFVATTKSRAASYWGHYYRYGQYRRCRDYPPYAALQRIERRLRGSEASRGARR